MENLQPAIDAQETFIDEWHESYLSDSKITGFICTFQLAYKQHRFYGLNDLKQFLAAADKQEKDVYLSLNAFEYGSRTTQALKQIRNIGVDIDCYKLNITVPRALEEVKKLILKGSMPNPNLVIFSGRGIQLIFSISGGASPKMAFLSQYITTQFISELKHIGADTSATDVTRVFRLPYSINSKSGKQVNVELWRTLEYSLLELYSFCTPLEQRRKPSKKRKGILAALPSKKGLKDLYSLNTARKNDLELLVSLRNGEIEKRNVLTYIYSYTVALILKNKEATIEFARQLNDRFNEPEKAREVTRTAGNAYDDALTFFEEFKKRDFRMWYQNMDGIIRPMKSGTIIDELDITPEEMQQLSTVIDKVEKQARDTKRKRKARGSVTRAEYNKEQQEKTDANVLAVVDLREKGYKQKQIAELLGLSKGRVSQLVKQIKKV
ncbi:AsnC family protein [Bacillus infantis]|uniref:AsnC family protein n=1 Tax=Bacillus infantis TaxID=324767 RepID=UPI003CF4291B